jgi:hypothetical protein
MTGESVEIRRLGNAEWSALLRQFDDANIYQTHSCGKMLWGKAKPEHVIMNNGGEPVGIAQVASIRAPLFRGGTALVFWGPLWKRKGLPENICAFSRLAEALRSEYVERRGMLLRVIPNESGGNTTEIRSHLEKAGFLYKGGFYRTYLLDLSLSADQLRKQLRQKWRNCLNRSEKEDLAVINGTDIDSYDAFSDIFRDMWMRKKITDIPIDPVKLRLILQDLPDDLKLRIFLCRKGGKPLAGAVISAIGNTAVLLSAASNEEGRKVMASYFLEWKIVEWLRDRGIGTYDFGGISPAHPSVNHFKEGLGGEEVGHAGLFELCTNRISSVFDKTLGIMRTFGL